MMKFDWFVTSAIIAVFTIIMVILMLPVQGMIMVHKYGTNSTQNRELVASINQSLLEGVRAIHFYAEEKVIVEPNPTGYTEYYIAGSYHYRTRTIRLYMRTQEVLLHELGHHICGHDERQALNFEKTQNCSIIVTPMPYGLVV